MSHNTPVTFTDKLQLAASHGSHPCHIHMTSAHIPHRQHQPLTLSFPIMEVIWGSHTLICISKTHSYLQGDYIDYHIISFIATNHTLYHQLIHSLYTIQINQKVIMKHVLNMWIPTKRYIISSYQCYILCFPFMYASSLLPLTHSCVLWPVYKTPIHVCICYLKYQIE